MPSKPKARKPISATECKWDDLFNRREAAVLAEIPLRLVDKAIEDRVVKPRRSRRRGTVLGPGDVLAIALIARTELPLRAQTKRSISEWVHGLTFEQALEHTAEMPLSDVVVIRFDTECRRVAERTCGYLKAREQHIESDPQIQGGEPVISGTRLPVYAVAERVNRGESIDSLAEDYPGISREAFEAARIYAESHPRRGRPARPWRDAR